MLIESWVRGYRKWFLSGFLALGKPTEVSSTDKLFIWGVNTEFKMMEELMCRNRLWVTMLRLLSGKLRRTRSMQLKVEPSESWQNSQLWQTNRQRTAGQTSKLGKILMFKAINIHFIICHQGIWGKYLNIIYILSNLCVNSEFHWLLWI